MCVRVSARYCVRVRTHTLSHTHTCGLVRGSGVRAWLVYLLCVCVYLNVGVCAQASSWSVYVCVCVCVCV
jgi:hypothetical protein